MNPKGAVMAVAGRVEGRLTVVTGAAGGLGQVFCASLAQQGARIVGVDIADQSATAAAVEAAGSEYVALELDITDESQCASMARTVQEGHGGAAIVVNNAGTFPVIPFAETTLDQWRAIHRLNVEGSFLVTRSLAPQLIAAGWGRIVFIASGAVWLGPPGMVAYTASKGALIGMMRALASELGGSGVTVNAITPGLTRTHTALTTAVRDQFDHVVSVQSIPRAEEPEDLASALLFLCDEGSGFVTGQAINVDGGAAKH
jgi:3-oxoacyl-[acyl-carrier protein] reductase